MRRIKKVPLFYFYEKSVKKSSFGGPGGSAQNPRKNGPKHTFFLLYRRKIGQKVVKTWSESRGILIFQEGAFFRFFAKNLTLVGHHTLGECLRCNMIYKIVEVKTHTTKLVTAHAEIKL